MFVFNLLFLFTITSYDKYTSCCKQRSARYRYPECKLESHTHLYQGIGGLGILNNSIALVKSRMRTHLALISE